MHPGLLPPELYTLGFVPRKSPTRRDGGFEEGRELLGGAETLRRLQRSLSLFLLVVILLSSVLYLLVILESSVLVLVPFF